MCIQNESGYKANLFHYKSKNNTRGDSPIYCRVRVNKQLAEFSTGIFVRPGEWDQLDKRIKGNTKEANILNRRISELKQNLDAIVWDLKTRKRAITAYGIREAYQRKGEHRGLLECYRLLMGQQKDLIGISITRGTYRMQMVRLSGIERYLKHIKRADIPLDEVKVSTARDLDLFLQKEGKEVSTINKHLHFLKRIMVFAFENEWIDKNPLQYLKLKKEPDREINYIEPWEMKLIEGLQLNECLTRARDLLIFACETGLAYCDMMKVGRESVALLNSSYWLVGTRQKSHIKFTIPITPKAIEILEKYDYHLPLLTNQKYNLYLKVIGESAGLSKVLHSHIGRKTKASNMVNAGIPENTICRVLGLKSIGILRNIYGKLEMERVAKDMLAASPQAQPTTIQPAPMLGFQRVRPLTLQLE